MTSSHKPPGEVVCVSVRERMLDMVTYHAILN